jgi:hypothetical protein
MCKLGCATSIYKKVLVSGVDIFQSTVITVVALGPDAGVK